MIPATLVIDIIPELELDAVPFSYFTFNERRTNPGFVRLFIRFCFQSNCHKSNDFCFSALVWSGFRKTIENVLLRRNFLLFLNILNLCFLSVNLTTTCLLFMPSLRTLKEVSVSVTPISFAMSHAAMQKSPVARPVTMLLLSLFF